jgi:hypothetical protein
MRVVAFLEGTAVGVDGVVLKHQVTALDGDKPRGKGAAHGVGRAVVGAAATVGARVKIQHVLPGKILQPLDTERFQVVQLVIRDAVHHRLDVAPVDAHEEHIEQRGDHVKVFSQGRKQRKKKKVRS